MKYVLIKDSTGVCFEAPSKAIRQGDRSAGRVKSLAYYCESQYQLYFDLSDIGAFKGKPFRQATISRKLHDTYHSEDYDGFLDALRQLKRLYKIKRLSDLSPTDGNHKHSKETCNCNTCTCEVVK